MSGITSTHRAFHNGCDSGRSIDYRHIRQVASYVPCQPSISELQGRSSEQTRTRHSGARSWPSDGPPYSAFGAQNRDPPRYHPDGRLAEGEPSAQVEQAPAGEAAWGAGAGAPRSEPWGVPMGPTFVA